MLHLRAAVYYLLMAAATIIYAPLSLLLYPLPYRLRYSVISRWALFNLWTAKLICGLDWRLEGAENIIDGPAIIFCKHQSAWETMALQAIFPPQVWVLKAELLRLPVFGWALALMDPIAIDRRSGRKAVDQIVEQGVQRLQTGRWVGVYPEGTRTAPGRRRRYGIGGAVLAAESGFPIVPVAHNAGLYWPRNSYIKRPGTIRVVVGPPIDSRNRSATELRDLAENWIEETMLDLVPEDERT